MVVVNILSFKECHASKSLKVAVFQHLLNAGGGCCGEEWKPWSVSLNDSGILLLPPPEQSLFKNNLLFIFPSVTTAMTAGEISKHNNVCKTAF